MPFGGVLFALLFCSVELPNVLLQMGLWGLISWWWTFVGGMKVVPQADRVLVRLEELPEVHFLEILLLGYSNCPRFDDLVLRQFCYFEFMAYWYVWSLKSTLCFTSNMCRASGNADMWSSSDRVVVWSWQIFFWRAVKRDRTAVCFLRMLYSGQHTLWTKMIYGLVYWAIWMEWKICVSILDSTSTGEWSRWNFVITKLMSVLIK